MINITLRTIRIFISHSPPLSLRIPVNPCNPMFIPRLFIPPFDCGGGGFLPGYDRSQGERGGKKVRPTLYSASGPAAPAAGKSKK